jgi:hypothetical protein
MILSSGVIKVTGGLMIYLGNSPDKPSMACLRKVPVCTVQTLMEIILVEK